MLRFVGVMNAAVWFGGALFYTCAMAPAFFAPEMEKLFGEVYTGVISLVMWDRYYALFYWCGVIALVHQLAEWVYLGRALQRLTLSLWAAVFCHALIAGLWLQPKLKQLHQIRYAREGVYAEAVLGPYDVWVDKIDYTVDESLREYFYRSSTVSFLPFLKMEQINPDIAGMHPKVQKEGEPMKDFIVRHEEDRGLENFINLVGIESPGLTSSPAIGKYVAAMVKELS